MTNPSDSTIRKSAFGRTNLFLTTSGGTFREVKCTASVSHQPNASVFHMHPSCTLTKNPQSVCWHCCEEFDNPGIRLPRLYDSFERVFHVLSSPLHVLRKSSPLHVLSSTLC